MNKHFMIRIICMSLIVLSYSCIKEIEYDFNITADELINEFLFDENSSNQKYLDKILRVTGVAIKINFNNQNEAYIDIHGDFTKKTIRCFLRGKLNAEINEINEGEEIIVIGLYRGKNTDILLYDCIIDYKTDAEVLTKLLKISAELAEKYYKKPEALGGGANSFREFNLPEQLSKSEYGIITYETSVDGEALKLVAIGKERGYDKKTPIKVVLQLYTKKEGYYKEFKKSINRVN